MAEKLITELQLRSEVTEDVNFSTDDGIQSYRVTAAQIAAYVKTTVLTQLLPTGIVSPFAGPSSDVPSGWLYCNGAAVSRSTYAALFAVLGVTHGQGDGSTTFNLPDYRGRFLRGVDGGTGRDADAAGRTAMGTGGNTGDNVGSVQGHAFQTHTHTQNAHTHTQNSHNHNLVARRYTENATVNHNQLSVTSEVASASTYSSGSVQYSSSAIGAQTATNQNTTAVNQNAAATGTHAQATANETRPVNANVNWIIKV